MNAGLWLSNLGSMILGMTLSTMILFSVAGRHREIDSGEGCLMMIVCLVGGGLSTLLYLTAINI